MNDLKARIERLEAIEEIRTLVASYAEMVDRRDVNGLVQLYVDDVQVGTKVGRDALQKSFRRVLGPSSPFRVTVHFVGAHLVEIDTADGDKATGTVYCRSEHEVADKWIVVMFKYFDKYRRVNGRWFFEDRVMKAYYGVDVLERPNGADRVKHQLLPGGLLATAELPESELSWVDFWSAFDDA
jgi:ketosteroid isomerase-like protein